jgi:hypothetical protein
MLGGQPVNVSTFNVAIVKCWMQCFSRPRDFCSRVQFSFVKFRKKLRTVRGTEVDTNVMGQSTIPRTYTVQLKYHMVPT